MAKNDMKLENFKVSKCSSSLQIDANLFCWLHMTQTARWNGFYSFQTHILEKFRQTAPLAFWSKIF